MAVNFVEKTDDAVRVRNVLASVSDKTGLDTFAQGLLKVNSGLKIYSTGGTFDAISKSLDEKAVGDRLIQVSEYTGQPEMQGGLVKTLDFKIYMGLLSETYNDAHRADMQRAGAEPVDMVIVNLYPFVRTIAKDGVTLEQARANIDIGGPCMVRAAAKNFLRVASVTDPQDYSMVLAELEKTDGHISLETRFNLARKAFAHTADYDTAISKYLGGVDFSLQQDCYTRR